MREKYVYKNCPIPGGGYVTGFVFHEKYPKILYCRTDIGGTYRFNFDEKRWESLIYHVTMEAAEETFPIALALDYEDPSALYIACGINRVPHGKLAVSHDYGYSFDYYEMPVMIHGNLNGRGTGFRLIVDKDDHSKLYFASQQDGLWISRNFGKTWEKLIGFPENYMTFVGKSNDNGILVAAGAGVSTLRRDHLRGHSLYASFDDGITFTELEGPEDTEIEGVDLAGHIAQRYSFDDNYLYVTYSVMGRNAYVRENGYSCDGGSVIGGKIYRYDLEKMKECIQNAVPGCYAKDITPEEYPDDTSIIPGLLEYGFSGICVSKSRPGMLAASTISKENGDCVYRSFDNGDTWECILNKLNTGCMDFRTAYMKPEHNGGGNLIHWLSDFKIDPFDDKTAWFNTGTGVFVTHNIDDKIVHFSDWSDGIEETVHLNLYSPPAGEVKLIDILGDLGGFAFKDLDCPCDNSFADGDGNRYITCINADYSDLHPETVVVTPRGNWTGKTKGGLIVSHNQCETFTRINLPFGLSDELDEAFKILETPNVNSGWVAMSPDTNHIVWSVADGIKLPVSRVIVSHDCGKNFKLVKVFGLDKKEKTGGRFKVFSDRVVSNRFYGFDEKSGLYISTDCGDTFYEVTVTVSKDFDMERESATVGESVALAGKSVAVGESVALAGKSVAVGESVASNIFPEVEFGLIDTINKTEIRAESGKSGVFYMALSSFGMWKVIFENDRAVCIKLSRGMDAVYRLGLGIGKDTTDYFGSPKTIYFAGTVAGEYGFYRTTDEGENFVRLNTDRQMFGDINSIEGDSRTFGRFFIATGSCGVLYGEPMI